MRSDSVRNLIEGQGERGGGGGDDIMITHLMRGDVCGGDLSDGGSG